MMFIHVNHMRLFLISDSSDPEETPTHAKPMILLTSARDKHLFLFTFNYIFVCVPFTFFSSPDHLTCLFYP